MKTLIAALTFAFVTAACGSADQATSPTEEAQFVDVEGDATAKRQLLPIEGTIRSVQVKSAAAPATGLWTEVEVEFLVPCTQNLENVASSHLRGFDGKIRILVSAFVSASKEGGDVACLGFSNHTETVSLPGVVDEDDLTLVHLNARSARIPADTVDVLSARKVEVVSTHSLCPDGVVCVTNGTVVVLAVTLNSCVNSLGPVAYHAEQAMIDGKPSPLMLTVHAIDFQHKSAAVVRCGQMTVADVEISLPMVFADQDDIQLQVLD